jgi:hypothetical protein
MAVAPTALDFVFAEQIDALNKRLIHRRMQFDGFSTAGFLAPYKAAQGPFGSQHSGLCLVNAHINNGGLVANAVTRIVISACPVEVAMKRVLD